MHSRRHCRPKSWSSAGPPWRASVSPALEAVAALALVVAVAHRWLSYSRWSLLLFVVTLWALPASRLSVFAALATVALVVGAVL